MNLTSASLALFLALVDDAPNWSGCPPIATKGRGGNVELKPGETGNLTDLQAKGLIKLDWDPESKLNWVTFTEAGEKLAAEHGKGIR